MENNFHVGEMAVYPAQGVAEVVGIEEKEISGKVHRFYVLRIVDTDMRIMVPLTKAQEVGLRQIIGEEEIAEVFEILREKEVHVDKQTWNRRYRGFMEKIKTGSLFEVAEVYRDLDEPELGFVICAGDEPAIKSCNPRLAFKRTKVLMNGDELCDHVFYVQKG